MPVLTFEYTSQPKCAASVKHMMDGMRLGVTSNVSHTGVLGEPVASTAGRDAGDTRETALAFHRRLSLTSI
jgi:hypothetical protein